MTDENMTSPASADNGNAKDRGFGRDTGQSDHHPAGMGSPAGTRRNDGEDTEKSYKDRRRSEMGGADTPNPFVNTPSASADASPSSSAPAVASADEGGGRSSKRMDGKPRPEPREDHDTVRAASTPPASEGTASTVASLERTPSSNEEDPADHADIGASPQPAAAAPATAEPGNMSGEHDAGNDSVPELIAEEGRNRVQLWLGLSLGLAIAGMSSILLPFMLLTFGAHPGMVGYLAIMFFIPIVITIVVAIEMVTNPKLRQGSSGVTVIILLVLVALIEVLYLFAAYRAGTGIVDVVVDTLHRLGNAIIFR